MTRIGAAAALLATLLVLARPATAQNEPDEGPCTPDSGLGFVHGTVLDSTTSIPLARAGVSVRWQPDPRVDRWEEEEGETDARGRFRVCDAPFDAPLSVRAGFWGERSREQSASLGDTLAAPLVVLVHGPHALLEGRVLDAQTSRPVADAEVRLERVAGAQITDPEGVFRFGRVPPGEYEVQVRHLGFRTVADTLEVDMSTTVEATIRVAPDVIPLEPISVVVRSLVLERSGFYEREDRGSGHFVTRQQIQDLQPLQSSEMLRRVPGVRLQRTRDGLVALGRANCPFRFVIDGARTSAGFTIDLVPIGDIEGLEIYLGPSQVPGEFSGFSSDVNGTCGVIVVWTRRNLRI